jgi:hypothetical protein
MFVLASIKYFVVASFLKEKKPVWFGIRIYIPCGVTAMSIFFYAGDRFVYFA